MTRPWPSRAEAGTLRFLIPLPGPPGPGLALRYGLALALFASGLFLWCTPPFPGVLGLLVVLTGHLPLWVRTQTTAPGGATPDDHEDVWVPTEAGWVDRITELEQKGRDWDVTPWDLTNKKGCGRVVLVTAVLAGVSIPIGLFLGGDPAVRLAIAALVLLLPVWVNGIRTTWNPSELLLKGQSLATAWQAVEATAEGDLEAVPLLALREGRRGKYPVDARLMLRPAEDDGSGFIGVQVQVTLNNVRGTDYPYLYCVVLGKPGFVLPRFAGAKKDKLREKKLVYELGHGDDVTYEVVRQHADRRGGWHTAPKVIESIMRTALADARDARQHNRKDS